MSVSTSCKAGNSVIQHAIRSRASDIHIEPFDKHLRIRFRVDGELLEIMKSQKPHMLLS
jgi:type IV pilus assembly protein PilB